jgi:hypothetical protein
VVYHYYFTITCCFTTWSSCIDKPNITDKGGYLGSDHDEERSKERYLTGNARYVTRQNLECILRLQVFDLTGLSGSVLTLINHPVVLARMNLLLLVVGWPLLLVVVLFFTSR